MAALTDVTTPRPRGEGFELDVPAGWRQGRGAYGGFTIAALIRAIEARIGDPVRRPRSITAELPAPVEPGAAAIAVDLLRSGKTLSAARAALVQNDELRAHVVAILAATRPGEGPLAWRDLAPPAVPPWRSLPPLAMERAVPWPEFAHNFEYRVASGLPVPTEGPAVTTGWVRPRVPCSVRDAAYVASVIDAWWPAAFTRFPASRPCMTVAFTLDLLTNLDGLDPDAPLLYRGTAPVCADGYFLETRELWGEDGRLVAINHQTFAVL